MLICLLELYGEDLLELFMSNLISHCTKKRRFPLRIPSVNVIKFAVLRILSHLLRKSLIKDFIFCLVSRKEWKLRELENSGKSLVQGFTNFAAPESVVTFKNSILHLPLNMVFQILHHFRLVELSLYLRTKT